MILGAHESVAGGLSRAFERGDKDGCRAIQIFTRSGRCWASRPLAREEISAFKAARKASGAPAIAHGSYLVNLATTDPTIRRKSLDCFLDEVRRVEQLGCDALVFHPGSNPETEKGLGLVAQAVRETLAQTPRFRSKILIEVTAGQGSCLGHRFEHLAELMDLIGNTRRVGICLDSCHLYAAGYDIATRSGYARVMTELDRVVGLKHVHAIHLNDCKKPLGCRVDRHEDIGKGTLGLTAFERLVNDPRFEQTVGVLETPNPDNYASSLELLRSLERGNRKRVAALQRVRRGFTGFEARTRAAG